MIEEYFYQVDPFCSIVVKELGRTTCDTTEVLSNNRPSVSAIELVSVVGMGVMLLLIVVLIVILVIYCIHKGFDIR